MLTLDDEKMESSSKINLNNVLWCMSIKDAYRHDALVIARLSKKRCISLDVGRRPFCTAHNHDWSKCGCPSTWETYSSITNLSKILNLEHKYEATKAQLFKKVDGAQSSI